MRRRQFIGMAAALPAAAVMPGMAALPRAEIPTGRTRRVKVERLYVTPHTQPNGLQATPEGLWVLDQQPDNWVSLVNWNDGKVIREFQVAGLDGAGGVTLDGNDMWINDTHHNTIVKVDQRNGTVLEKYWNHGQGAAYRMPNDPAAFESDRTLHPDPFPPPPRPAGAAGAAGGGRAGGAGAGAAGAAGAGRAGGAGAAPGGGGGGGGGGGAALPYGRMPLTTENGLRGNSGAGIEIRDGFLYHASMYNRQAWMVNTRNWEVHGVWPLPGNRAHGVAWDPSGDGLWISDTNLMAFFRHDTRTGRIMETIQLTDQDPGIHGVTYHDGHIWYCDHIGYMCNFRLT